MRRKLEDQIKLMQEEWKLKLEGLAVEQRLLLAQKDKAIEMQKLEIRRLEKKLEKRPREIIVEKPVLQEKIVEVEKAVEPQVNAVEKRQIVVENKELEQRYIAQLEAMSKEVSRVTLAMAEKTQEVEMLKSRLQEIPRSIPVQGNIQRGYGFYPAHGMPPI